MNLQPQASPELAHLGALIEAVEIGMLTTVEADGRMRSRPLRTLQMDADGALWFITSIASAKIGELDAHRRITLSYCRPQHESYVSVSGVTQILRDPAQARALWSTSLLPWVPDGVEDPELVLLKVTVEEAEYWDAHHGRMLAVLGSTARPENEKIRIAPDSVP